MANQFNASHPVVDGKVASVTIRKVSSGLGYDYIRTGRYVPDGYTPSNSLYVKMLEADGIGISTVSDSLVTNTAGMLISNEKYDELSAKYGTVNLKAVVDAVAAGDLTMGYTNPYTSGTGLNFLVSTLLAYDSTNPLSDTATAGFQAFQANIPYVATTTQQMSSSASKGSFDGFVTEYQTYANNASQQATYKFVPFGYLHDNPLVTTTGTSQDKKDILAAFAEYCASSESQALATQYGFNADLGYTCENPDVDGSVLTAAQALWKQDKDSGRPIIAVFVADVSGSMDGEPLNALKQSLVNGMQYINSTNYVGLVSYSTNVTIELPIAQFDINQEAYFKGAVECLSAGGNTSTYDGIIVATDMLLKASEEHPDAKLMMFVLSDGNENSSRTSFTTIKTDISALQIPIYTIGYNANIDALQQLSDINEAASINASTDDVVYQLKNLFNSNL
jgi:Ca-activated chloride channel family protein